MKNITFNTTFPMAHFALLSLLFLGAGQNIANATVSTPDITCRNGNTRIELINLSAFSQKDKRADIYQAGGTVPIDQISGLCQRYDFSTFLNPVLVIEKMGMPLVIGNQESAPFITGDDPNEVHVGQYGTESFECEIHYDFGPDHSCPRP